MHLNIGCHKEEERYISTSTSNFMEEKMENTPSTLFKVISIFKKHFSRRKEKLKGYKIILHRIIRNILKPGQYNAYVIVGHSEAYLTYFDRFIYTYERTGIIRRKPSESIHKAAYLARIVGRITRAVHLVHLP